MAVVTLSRYVVSDATLLHGEPVVKKGEDDVIGLMQESDSKRGISFFLSKGRVKRIVLGW